MYGCGRNPMLKSLKSILSKSKSVCLLAQIPGLRSTCIHTTGFEQLNKRRYNEIVHNKAKHDSLVYSQ